jgi:type III secretion system YscD/HrpQ family protein
MAGYLIAEEGPLAGLIIRFEEGDEWILGRDPEEVSIILEDSMVSRKHVICHLTAEGYVLENLSSVNPATQNGKVITEAVLLREGDILQIGSTFFRFTEQTPVVAEETPDEVEPPAPLEETQQLSSVSIESGTDARWMLKVISGPNAGAEFGMLRASSYILGKDPNLCDIVFQDLSVSRQHARINVNDDNRVVIEDLGSRNGVLINGELIGERKELTSQDLVALGTTSFLLIDREQIHETIISPPAVAPMKIEEEIPATAEEIAVQQAAVEKRDWKETIIPTRMLILSGVLAVAVIGGFASMLALFKTETVTLDVKDPNDEIKMALHGFDDVQFSFNPANGKLFLVGHVLTTVDKQELQYKMNNLSFVASIDDNVIVDEYVWQNMNGLLQTNSNWQGVSIYSTSPGRFVIKGYLQTNEQAQALADYINLNFPYLDRMENQVVVESNLQAQVQGMLIEKGFSGVSFQLNNGELVLSGRVDQKQTSQFTGTVEGFKALNGIRTVKNFVAYTTANTSRVDISQQYQVSGYSKKDNENMFIVINGRILSLGDNLDGMLITNILPNMVLLEKDGIKFRINYNLQ